MKTLRISISFLLLALSPACGQQLVEFGKSDNGTVPLVVSTSPVNAATSVPVTSAIRATFSQAMDPASIDGQTFTIEQGSTVVAGTVTYINVVATFTPAADLAANAGFIAKISTRAKSTGGKALAADYSWIFATGAAGILSPAVVSSDPADGATGVVLNKQISVTFTDAMDPSTLNSTTFTVKNGTTIVAGVVSYIGTTATFSPSSNLAASTVFTATISTGAEDVAGNALVAEHTWSFTTGTTVDATPPTVVSTSPVDVATNVSISKRVTATFSEPMDPTTVNAATFILQYGATLVPGTVTYVAAGTTGTFIPASALALNTTYTGTITTGAKDSAGNPLTSNFIWSFATSACGQAPVALGAADNFVVLAGSTVTSTGVTSVTGDLGVSPGTAVTGFPPGTIIGAQHAGDPTAAQGVADLTTAYDDAAGRTLCAVTVAGNIGGSTLTPGLYKSTSSLEISSGDLTLDAQGDPDAVFIFQMASTLTTTAGRQVIMTGGAKSTNVFWQVGTSATLGTTSAFQGTIMADQAITLDTGATLNGRALARIAAVSLDANTIVKPAP